MTLLKKKYTLREIVGYWGGKIKKKTNIMPTSRLDKKINAGSLAARPPGTGKAYEKKKKKKKDKTGGRV